MINLSIFLVGFILGLFSILILAAIYLLHRPRYVAPTKYRREWRDKAERDLLEEMFDELNQKKSVEPIYMYGVTGEER